MFAVLLLSDWVHTRQEQRQVQNQPRHVVFHRQDISHKASSHEHKTHHHYCYQGHRLGTQSFATASALSSTDPHSTAPSTNRQNVLRQRLSSEPCPAQPQQPVRPQGPCGSCHRRWIRHWIDGHPYAARRFEIMHLPY